MRVVVVGGGISGLVSAYVLAKNGVKVVLFEKGHYLGGHDNTVTNFDGVDLDLGFMVFNPVAHPNIMELCDDLGVNLETSEMSLSVSLDEGAGCEWANRNGLPSLFAQKRNILNPLFWQMLKDITKFKNDVISYLEVLENNPDIDCHETLGQFIKSHGYSELFKKAYLIPICGSMWSSPSEGVMSFSAFSVLSFLRDHHLLELFGNCQCLRVKGHSHCYVKKMKEELESRGCMIRTGCEVHMVSITDEGLAVFCKDGSKELCERCILAVRAPVAVRLLGDQATPAELRVLDGFKYVYSDFFLHQDKNLMPQNPATWAALNFLGHTDGKVCVTYWLNVLQNIGETSLPFLVTVNPGHAPKDTLLKWTTSHSIPSIAASKASFQLHHIQGKRMIWFCGAYQGYGSHDDELKAGMAAAHGILGYSSALLKNPKYMAPSLLESGARLLVTRFLRHFISTGTLILLEEGGTMFIFEGTKRGCSLRTVMKVHHPNFYWKVMTQADLGIADAYINGDFSFINKDQGLLDLFMIFIANKDLNHSMSKLNKKRFRGWWSPLLFTASVASAKYFFKHVSRQNTLTQARRNISRHYDLSNEFFALFLDERMQYSSAIFKTMEEELKVAQLRKISSLIEKARINEKHEVLDIGCGWGIFAIEVVRRTRCKYTGITLSEEQLKYAEQKVKDAGLQDHIRLLLCDYRQLPDTYKYDRIISCEMLEHVGHEFFEMFFGCCESLLAEDGLLVLQFISMPDEFYEEYIRSAGFIKEYIFPGGCLPSLSKITSAMATASRLCVEHLENIGIHYYPTLRYWRKNLLENRSKILDLGFDEKFIRTWEYYFDYCASGFKSRTLGDYQVVFSRPGNVAAFSNPLKGFPSAF